MKSEYRQVTSQFKIKIFVANSFTYVPYSETGYFSHLVTDYLSGHPDIKPFFLHTPDALGISAAIKDRESKKTDRKTLVDTLTRQYAQLTRYPKAEENIALLTDENTYTVCTAHQPNLLTGYLYFIYKILHAIKLAEELTELHPDKRFVPVYYMGSEDNDLEELGTFRFRGEKYVWDGDGQTGAVGRMNTTGLSKLLTSLFHIFGPPGSNCDELEKMLTQAYLQHNTIGNATQYLVNELFGRFGLVVIDPDDAALKKAFIPVMKDELLHQNSYDIITAQIEKLGVHYKIQAQPRFINLFYIDDEIRERIERRGEEWVVLNTNITWTKEELLDELETHPERFSPNVMLRGLFQETILPDVAFIGGGAEVAYWLQLKTLFAYYKVCCPVILLRQSVLWIGPLESRLLSRSELTIREIFKKETDLIHDYINRHTNNEWQTTEETKSIEAILHSLRQKAADLDPTLRSSADAALAKMRHQLDVLEKKMLRAEKKKLQTQLQKIIRIKNTLFPNNGLQERIENFSEYYLQYGATFFDILKKGIEPLKSEFLVVDAHSALPITI